MTELKQKRLGGWLITAGVVLVTIAAAQPQVDSLLSSRLPGKWASILALLGIFTIASGIALWLFSRVSIPHPFDSNFECYRAKKRELPAIHNLAKEFFGDDVSPLQVMTDWHGKNSAVFHLIVIVKRTSLEYNRRIVGYCCIIPLVEDGVKKIVTGEITGRDIPVSYIASSRKDCKAVYIGGIAAKGGKAKATLLAVSRKEFTKWSRIFYTRPITPDGLRIAKKNGFTAIDPSNHGKMGHIYKLEI